MNIRHICAGIVILELIFIAAVWAINFQEITTSEYKELLPYAKGNDSTVLSLIQKATDDSVITRYEYSKIKDAIQGE